MAIAMPVSPNSPRSVTASSSMAIVAAPQIDAPPIEPSSVAGSGEPTASATFGIVPIRLKARRHAHKLDVADRGNRPGAFLVAAGECREAVGREVAAAHSEQGNGALDG